MKKEYCDYIWDIVTGDTTRHEHYVRAMYDWPESVLSLIKTKNVVPGEPRGEIVAIREWDDRLSIPETFPMSKRILVSYHGDLLNYRVSEKFINKVIKIMEKCRHHTFFLLTKNVRRYQKFKWPKNAVLGVRVEEQAEVAHYMSHLRQNEKNDLWVLCDPLAEYITLRWDRLAWIVFDAPDNIPPPKVIDILLTAQSAARFRIPVWITDATGFDKPQKEEPVLRA
jgi:protein gp37